MLIKLITSLFLLLFSCASMGIEYWMYEVVSAKTEFEPVSQRVYKLAPLDRLYGQGKVNMSVVSYIETEIVAHEAIQNGSWVLMAVYPSGRKFVMDVTQSRKGLINNDSVRNMMFDIIEDALQNQINERPTFITSIMKVNMSLSKHTLPKIELDRSEKDNINLMLVDFYLTKLMLPISKYFQSIVNVRFELAFREEGVNIRLYNRSDRFYSARQMYDPFQPLSPKLR
jgi:hypothetical protein